jgi:hypothetical protein
VSVSALGLKVTSRCAAVLDERDTGTADAFEEIFADSLLVAEFLTRLQTWWRPNDGWLFRCVPETARMFRLASGDVVLGLAFNEDKTKIVRLSEGFDSSA